MQHFVFYVSGMFRLFITVTDDESPFEGQKTNMNPVEATEFLGQTYP